MKEREHSEESIEEWMKQAKEYAEQNHSIVLPNDHDFWECVQVYWKFEMTPERAVKNAIKIFYT